MVWFGEDSFNALINSGFTFNTRFGSDWWTLSERILASPQDQDPLWRRQVQVDPRYRPFYAAKYTKVSFCPGLFAFENEQNEGEWRISSALWHRSIQLGDLRRQNSTPAEFSRLIAFYHFDESSKGIAMYQSSCKNSPSIASTSVVFVGIKY